ncbi:MAG: hypothetical protein HP000_05035 [Odoribacter sp.]|nr:hypothetical protein [Odoribacter sp.]
MNEIVFADNSICYKVSLMEATFLKNIYTTIKDLSNYIENSRQLYNWFTSTLNQKDFEKCSFPKEIVTESNTILIDCLTAINNQSILNNFTIEVGTELKGYILSDNIFEKIHHINNIYIIIYKQTEKSNNSENSILNQLSRRYPQIKEVYKEFTEHRKTLEKFEKEIHDVRCEIAAHFNASLNYWEYYKRLSKYKSDDILAMTSQFIKKLSLQSNVYTVLLGYLRQRTDKIYSEYVSSGAI